MSANDGLTPVERAFNELKKDFVAFEKRVTANSEALAKVQESTTRKNQFDKLDRGLRK